MKRINIFEADVEYDADDPEGFRAGMNRFGPSIGASMLGGSIYELPSGQSNCPYYYEYGRDEWLLVPEGTLTLRHTGGEEELGSGEVVCFPNGPEGAHRLSNRSDATIRVLMLATMNDPSAAGYPDSDKLGIWPGDERDTLLFRRSSSSAARCSRHVPSPGLGTGPVVTCTRDDSSRRGVCLSCTSGAARPIRARPESWT